MKLSARVIKWGSAELFFIISVLSTVMFGIFSAKVAKEMSISSTALGWLSGFFFIAYAITQLYSGRLFVMFQARTILSVSAIIAGVGACLFAMTSSLVLMFLARILLGIGLASTFVGVLFVIQDNYTIDEFPLMSSLSQSLANIGGGLFGFFAENIIGHYDFRTAYLVLGLGFFISAIIIFMLLHANKTKSRNKTVSVTMIDGLMVVMKNPQVWYAALYFSGLFGAMLTYSDLFAVSYQVEGFHISFANATIINSMIPFGLSIGGVLAGYFAQRMNNYAVPARVISALAIIMFAIILFIRFESAYAVLIVSIISFLFGIGCSGSILAFQCIQKQISDSNLKPLATSFVLTFSYTFSGLIEQPIVGSFIAKTQLSSINLNTNQHVFNGFIFDPTLHDSWSKYNNGLYIILFFIILSFLASLKFKVDLKK